MRRFDWAATVLVTIATTAFACGDSARAVDDDGSGGTATAGSGAGTTTSTGTSGGGGDACSEFMSEASTQQVNVVLQNGAATDRYVMVSAFECDPHSIERDAPGGYEPVRQSVGFQCGCECPGPPPPGPDRLERIPAGGEVTLTWDARELTTCVTEEDCLETYGFEGFASITHGFPVPAPAGDYRITYQLFETLPEYCNESGGEIRCDPTDGGPGCVGELVAEATFALPDSGDVNTTVAVN